MDVLTAFIIISGILFLCQIITLIMVLRLRKKQPDFTSGLFRESQAKTHSIIYKAIQQANKILVAAELKGLHLLSKEKITGEELSNHFREHLEAIEKVLEAQMESNAKHAEDTYAAFIASAEASINNNITQNQKMLEQKAQGLIERTESLLTKFTSDMEAKVKGGVDKEIEATTAEIDKYKQNRLRIIDERIVDILEDVLLVVLDKKLSLADQSELIYKALEQAKKEHLFSSPAK